MATVLLLGPARVIGGVGAVTLPGGTVDAITSALVDRFGDPMAKLLAVSRIWVDGEPAAGSDAVGPEAEVSILPPISGG